MTYTNKLSHYRTKANLTQQEVAYLLGIESTSRLSQWEKGNTMPSLPNIFKLSIIYKMSVEVLYRPLLKKLTRFYDTHRTFSEVSTEPVPGIKKTRHELLEEFADIIVNLYLEQARGKDETF
jgi:transcriptional regulator with XRE-family HTH domain